MSSLSAAQDAALRGQVMHRDLGQPLGFASVTVVARGTQQLTDERGAFVLRGLPAGEVRLVFKRIGFSPKDTTLRIGQGETIDLRVELSRLALQLPATIVRGRCTDDSPLERGPEILEQLFDQVRQNAERVVLLAESRPFAIELLRTSGRMAPGGMFLPENVEEVLRSPIPEHRYEPKNVVRRSTGTGAGPNEWYVLVPELPDLADTAFTNNHCFRYAGTTTFFGDSVIRVDFEPVPWLAREVDIEGSAYLTVSGYQLVGTVTRLNRIPGQFRRDGLREFTVTARFSELVPGIPVLFHWETTNVYRSPTFPRVERGEMTAIRWKDSTSVPPER